MSWIDHFGLIAPVYERLIRGGASERLQALLEMPPGGRLLDAGGGTGRVSAGFASDSSQVVIADSSVKMLLQARRKNDLQPAAAHSERLPFPDECFDRIMMVDALHHVSSQRETAAELWRVLRPGGRIVIQEPDVRHWGVKMVALAEKLALMRSHFLEPVKIAALFPWTRFPVRIVVESYNAYIVVQK